MPVNDLSRPNGAFARTTQPDEWRINMSDAWQVLWWCRYLGLTKTQLEHAIQHSGPVIADVRRYLDSEPALTAATTELSLA